MVALSSSSGTVTVANADNDEPGVGAVFGYQGLLGGDDTLSFGERSDPRRPVFNNPQSEMFSVTFRVLAVDSTSGESKALSIQDGKRVGDGLPGTTTATFPDLPDGAFYRVTVNPLLGTVLVELID